MPEQHWSDRLQGVKSDLQELRRWPLVCVIVYFQLHVVQRGSGLPSRRPPHRLPTGRLASSSDRAASVPAEPGKHGAGPAITTAPAMWRAARRLRDWCCRVQQRGLGNTRRWSQGEPALATNWYRRQRHGRPSVHQCLGSVAVM